MRSGVSNALRGIRRFGAYNHVGEHAKKIGFYRKALFALETTYLTCLHETSRLTYLEPTDQVWLVLGIGSAFIALSEFGGTFSSAWSAAQAGRWAAARLGRRGLM